MPRPKSLTPNYRLRQNGAGIWEVHWRQNDNTAKRSTGERERPLAEKEALKIIAERTAPRPSGKHLETCGDVLDEYRRARIMEVASKVGLEESIRPLKVFFAGMAPDAITDSVVDAYRDHRRGMTSRLGRRYSDGTIRRELNVLRAALNWAARNRKIGSKIEVRARLEQPAIRDRWLTREEVRAVLQHAAPHTDLFIRLALATGARMSAILELTWDRITWLSDDFNPTWKRSDGDADVLELRGGLLIDMGKGVGNKHRAKVMIGENPGLCDALRRARARAKTGYVIEFRGKPIRAVDSGLFGACDKAGVARFRAHSMKHTAVTWMVQAGIPFDQISAMVSTSAATLRKHYGHYSPEHVGRVGDTLSV